jgi:hypothetical protein
LPWLDEPANIKAEAARIAITTRIPCVAIGVPG